MAKLNKEIFGCLREIFGDKGLITDFYDVACYGFDASGIESLPLAVVFPENKEQISLLLKRCNDWKLPVTPRGSASATTGAAVPASNGVVLCLSRMNKIINVDPVELTACVEPGVITGVLQKEVEKYGLFYPPDPASLNFCTIGGNVSTCAGGARAVKYGVTKDYVRSLEVVLSDGSIIETGAKTSKGVVGYDLTRLFVGSEGTLGVITKIVLKLVPLPDRVKTICVGFLNVQHAVDAVTCLFVSGILPRCAEFIDKKTLSLIKKEFPFEIKDDTKALLIIESDGSPSQVDEEAKKIIGCAKKNNATVIFEATNDDERESIWQARRGISPSLKRKGFDRKVSEDICVPRKEIGNFLDFLDTLSIKDQVEIFSFGHIGDGNIHVNLLFNNNDQKILSKVDEIICSIMNRVIDLGGTISGEHGVGLTKKPFITIELDKKVIALHREIKMVFDPNNILNPGKIF